ncbi:MAG: cytochrome D ubiquinol oxidase subunit I [Verrucomicrobia bacterium]|nr:cytochrome D ubiquinol oxidase subunit I [Verrucomicrobiota bacterium]
MLDPKNWEETKQIGHRMLDDLFEYLEHLRDTPVWTYAPDAIRDHFHAPLPEQPQPLDAVYDEFKKYIWPYIGGNIHPGFMGWAQGGGTAVGMLAELLAAGLNANLGGRDHIPILVERQITLWLSELLHFPKTASGLFVTGTSLANFMALLIAKTNASGTSSRVEGVSPLLRGYTSQATHSCVIKAFEMAGLGSKGLRIVPMNVEDLQAAVDKDRSEGLQPFIVIANAGTVDTGAIDDLQALHRFCKKEKLWFHIDGAIGALGMLSPRIAPLLKGIEHADSIALDFHKWGQVPYEAGFILVRDAKKQLETFAAEGAYLKRAKKGMAAGDIWPCDYGPNLSRGFQALKTWFTIKAYGAESLGKMIEHTCDLASYAAKKILASDHLELLAPVTLNIVCFRYKAASLKRSNEINQAIVEELQLSGRVAPSTTLIDGKLAIRAAFFNHRTSYADVDYLLTRVLDTKVFQTQQ